MFALSGLRVSLSPWFNSPSDKTAPGDTRRVGAGKTGLAGLGRGDGAGREDFLAGKYGAHAGKYWVHAGKRAALAGKNRALAGKYGALAGKDRAHAGKDRVHAGEHVEPAGGNAGRAFRNSDLAG